MLKHLNLFYEQPPHRDRRFRFDRYLQRFKVFLRRGTSPWGQMRVFLNLCNGLKKIPVPYMVNNYEYIKRHPEEIACIVGKETVLNKLNWKNPILYGPNIYDHPIDDPDLLQRLPIKQILVPSEWYRQMCEQAWGELVTVWTSGVDTDKWMPQPRAEKDIDFLIYNKVFWDYEQRELDLVQPIRTALTARGLKVAEIRYDYYREHYFRSLLKRSRAMIFLSAHESFGFARMQAHSCDLPVLAWDPGGFWPDPEYYPHKVQFAPVSSVPYWDDRCGVRFRTIDEFPGKLTEFLDKLRSESFAPREFVMEDFTLEKKAREYLETVQKLEHSLT
jgi:glycosyltransferase involved in cell wall biosynthesis